MPMRTCDSWLDEVPDASSRAQVQYGGVGGPAGGGSDDFNFSCAGLPAFGLGALSWDYNNYTWHTDRDTFDKIVFDDLKSNATLTAMLVYLASEDPTMIAHINPDSARAAFAARPQDESHGGGRARGARRWAARVAPMREGAAQHEPAASLTRAPHTPCQPGLLGLLGLLGLPMRECS